MDSPLDMEESSTMYGSLLDVSNMEEVPPSSNSFVCHECNKRSTCKINLSRHRKTHSSNPFRCSDCNLFFSTEADQKRHMEQKHTCNVCEVCGKGFHRLRDLWVHLNSYNPELTEESSLNCPFERCQKVFHRT